jgi:hypothetical protein
MPTAWLLLCSSGRQLSAIGATNQAAQADMSGPCWVTACRNLVNSYIISTKRLFARVPN